MISFPWPQANEIHIHCCALDSEVERYIAPDERQRAERLLDPQIQSRFIASRGLLREILGTYLGVPPQGLQLAVQEQGKPYLSACATRLDFNLSHSGSLLLLAVAADRDVGIDLEQIRHDTPFPEMARLTFSPQEQHELFALPDHQQRNAFYRCWTRKEAFLKACGRGFSLPSHRFDVSLLENPTPMIAPDNHSRWLLQDISVPDGYCAALAAQGSAPIIRYF